MSSVFRQKQDEGRGKTLAPYLVPVALHHRPGQPAEVTFTNGSKAAASCLRCHDAPCMLLREDELRASNLPEFPADRSPEVCASGAISRSGGTGAPVIDPAACMLCGACAARCPVGVIALVPTAVVNDAPNAAFVETADHPEAQMLATRAIFEGVARDGVLLEESDAVVDEMRFRLVKEWKRLGDRFPTTLARNLLLAVGVGATMRRRGDVAVRMDLLLGPPGVEVGCAEVEFGDDAVLDSPRDLLDDVAVLAGRLGQDKTKLVTLIISDVLPNRRSEYWRIVQDVRKVLGLNVGTVTVLALMLLAWNLRRLRLEPNHAFYADVDTDSYRARVLEPLLERPLKLGSTPRAYVEVAK